MEKKYRNYVKKNKINDAAVPDERVRIFWDGMPLWGRLRMLSELFKENKTAIVASTYCNSWIFDEFDEKEPLESTALAYTKIFINRSERVKLEILLKESSDEIKSAVYKSIALISEKILHNTKAAKNEEDQIHSYNPEIDDKDIINIRVLLGKMTAYFDS
ncbi:MAG: 2-hydroxyacyl-CoA dehydratase family protein, partial [Candidatus Bathyarchaeia archaeon]